MNVRYDRRTRIVCTLGPATDDREVLDAMFAAGLDVARINAAHGSATEHSKRIRVVRALARKHRRPVAVLIDLPGPKLRLGKIGGDARELNRGDRITLVSGRSSDGPELPVALASFAETVRRGESVFLADGAVHLKIASVRCGLVLADVLAGGRVRSGSGVNLPESDLRVSIPTRDDARWISFAIKEKVEWIGVSFVRSVADIEAVRKRLRGTSLTLPRIIAKIEKREALADLNAVVDAADAVMVARGDLGVETPLAGVPMVQKKIIATANQAAKPVITATQMLESMVEDPTPTRAEVTDIANAVLDGTDAVMLSAETAMGHHPALAVGVLTDVIRATESSYPFGALLEYPRGPLRPGLTETLAAEACRIAAERGARALVVPAHSVEDIARVSRYRPEAPILAISRSAELRNALSLLWGVWPMAPGALRTVSGVGPVIIIESSSGRTLDTLRVDSS